MNTWTPLWSSTVDSTLWEEPTDVRILFFTMLMLRDPDHVVRMPLRVIAKKANLAEDKEESYTRAEAAMEVLLSPDKRSRENQEHEGRRILRMENGHWLVINGAKYIEQMQHLWRRLRKTQSQKAKREAARASEGAGSNGSAGTTAEERSGPPVGVEQAEEAAGGFVPRREHATEPAPPPPQGEPEPEEQQPEFDDPQY